MDKKKKLIILGAAAAVVIAVVLISCFVCFHSWQDAACESPMTCEKCGKTRGEPLAHEWVEATCSEPKHCLLCGKTEGTTVEHKWQEATCITAKTCTICGEIDGEPLGHAVKKWTVTKETSCSAEGERAGYCERCKKDCTEAIKKLPHTESDWKVVKDYVIKSDATVAPGTEAIVCTVCNKQIKTRKYTVKLRSFFILWGKNAITGTNTGKKRLKRASERSKWLHRRSFCARRSGFGWHTKVRCLPR